MDGAPKCGWQRVGWSCPEYKSGPIDATPEEYEEEEEARGGCDVIMLRYWLEGERRLRGTKHRAENRNHVSADWLVKIWSLPTELPNLVLVFIFGCRTSWLLLNYRALLSTEERNESQKHNFERGRSSSDRDERGAEGAGQVPLFKMSSTECQNECCGHTLWLFLCHISYEVPRGSIVVEKDYQIWVKLHLTIVLN